MSYAQINPPVYEVYQPGTPWHPGSTGWSRPYVPGWAQNPNLLDRYRYAVQGLGCGGAGGCGCGCKGTGQNNGESGVGAYYPTETVWPIPQGGLGSYYERVMNLPVSGMGENGSSAQVVPISSGQCPKGYHSAKAATIQGAVQVESDVCVKEQRWLYAGLGLVAGYILAKVF